MTVFSPSDATTLYRMIADNEEWLIDRILYYAKRHGYSAYTSTLREAWRQSVAGLSRPLLETLKNGIRDVELGPDEDCLTDPMAQFGILEAQRHRKRGVRLSMFLGLLKYYRQTYADLVDQELMDREAVRRSIRLLRRIFDRIEIGLVSAWHAPSYDERMAEMQQATRAMTNEKNKYLTLFESLQSPVAVLDADHRVDAVNHAWARLFGGASTPGADDYDNDRSAHSLAWLTDEISALTQNRQCEKTVEKTVNTKLGRRDMAVKIKRMLDVSDKFSGCVVLLDDVTLRKRTETALQETTIWLTEMYNALEEAVFLTTPTGKIVDANIAAVKIFGFSAAELKHQTTQRLHVDQKHYQLFRSRVRETLAKGKAAVFEYPVKRKNGEIFPAMLHIALLKKARATPFGIVCVLRDISELKRAEEANRKNERLQGALELAGAVCHDMNQPLMAIGGYAELVLMECPADAAYLHYLRKIIEQVAKMGAITDKLKNVTRYETKPYLDQQIIDIEKATDDAGRKA